MECVKGVIFGLAGTELSAEERDFFAQAQPYGYILFARNIVNPEQLKSLTADLRSITKDAHILIDQEGGRVMRLKADKGFVEHPSMEDIVRNNIDIVENFRTLGQQLNSYGIDVNCAPVADLFFAYANKVIGSRSFGDDVEAVSKAVLKALEGLHAAGVEGVVKHIPGHGRALVDSHHDLPVLDTPLEVLEQSDFLVFKNVVANFKYAMTAHVVYKALDEHNPATLSKIVIDYIRDVIGFTGLLMTDDIGMSALGGSMYDRAFDALQAGCDLVLHCSGKINEMQEVMRAFHKWISE